MLLLLLLWLQLFWACVPAWLHGHYYDYGWYVPPLALFFAFRLRNPLRVTRATPPVTLPTAAGLIGLFLVLAALRTVHHVDPRWTLPLWIHAGVVVAISYHTLRKWSAPDASRRFIPVILFALTAIPLPSVVERFMVSQLTDSVIASTTHLLTLLGRPVMAMGDQIGSYGEVVRVTDGCSGIQSGQSFLMASLFFGEWMKLKFTGRWIMVAAGVLTAWSLNVVRATSLAWIQFEHGEEAFQAAHDAAGLLAFALGSSILLWTSSALTQQGTLRKISRTRVEGRRA
jgi:exosortase